MVDDATIIMCSLGGILTLACGLVVVGVAQRWPKKALPAAEATDDARAPDAPAAAASSPSSKKKKKSSKSKASAEVTAEDEARASLPEIKVGTRCWHRQALEWCRVARVYYDDLPPYCARR